MTEAGKGHATVNGGLQLSMKDISYEILDLLKQYGSSPEGIRRALDNESRPEVLHALSDIRENLLEWLDFTGSREVLQIGSGYGVLTGLLASRCAHVTVMDQADENLAVNRERNKDYSNITYSGKARKSGMRLLLALPFWDRRDAWLLPVKMRWDSGTWQGGTMRKVSVPEGRQRKPAGVQVLPRRIFIIPYLTTECPYQSTQTGTCRERGKSPAPLSPMTAPGMPASMRRKCLTG